MAIVNITNCVILSAPSLHTSDRMLVTQLHYFHTNAAQMFCLQLQFTTIKLIIHYDTDRDHHC